MADERYKRTDLDGIRTYRIPELDNRELPSSTTILQNKRKIAIEIWGPRVVAEYVLNEVIQGLKEGRLTIADIQKLNPDEFVMEAKSAPRLIKEREGEKGSRVHDVAAEIFRSLMDGKEIDLACDEDILEPVQALIKWTNEHNVVPVAVEERVWTDEFGGYAGTLDLVAYVDDRLLTIDLKSSKAVYDEYRQQVASYDFAWCERNPDKHTEGSAILILNKLTGLPEFYTYTKEETFDYLALFAYLCLYWHQDEAIKAKVKEKREQAKEEKKEKKAKAKPKAKVKTPDPEPDPF